MKSAEASAQMAAQSMALVMGTVMMQKAFGRHADKAVRTAEAEAARLEGLLSRFRPDSDVGRINNAAGGGCEKIRAEVYRVIARAMEFSKLSDGRFDVTIAPLVDLWSTAKDTLAPPSGNDIADALRLVDFRRIKLDQQGRACGLKQSGQSIDLGGIGKGYAADKVAGVYRRHGVSSAFINLGGNVVALGTKPGGQPWKIGIQHPRQENKLIGIVSVIDKTVVTSGDYQRYFIDRDGRRWHHILDPRTGYPAESGLASVTIIGDCSMVADALSTVLFIAGLEHTEHILKAFPGTGAILIDHDLQIHMTRNLSGCFSSDHAVYVLDF